MQLEQSEWNYDYLLYCFTTSDNNFPEIHSTFYDSFSLGTGTMTGLLVVKYLSLGFCLGRIKF